MEKADPVQMRKALEVVQAFKENMILFVPMPVLDEDDKRELYRKVHDRLDVILSECDNATGQEDNDLCDR